MTTIDYEIPGYRLEVGTPNEFVGDMASIESLLERLGHVSIDYIRLNLPNARFIAVARRGADIVSICVLKGPNKQRNESLAKKSGYPLTSTASEIGYAATYEQHTKLGLGGRLHQELLRCTNDVAYATVRIGNDAENHLLGKHGFRPEGATWQGEGDYKVGLWVRTTANKP